jgi:tRNA-dihydrouridine synthase B
MSLPENHTFYLAPFQGITTHIFREVCTRHFPGTDKLFTAFFTGIQSAKSLRRWKTELENTEHHGVPVVPQVLSKDPSEILLFARICRDLGFEEINWNLGCPFPRVAKKMRGSGLLPYPEKVGEILDKAMPEMPLRFSVKCRLGYHSADEIFTLLPVFHRYPLSEIIVHARLGIQMYKGTPDTKTFGRIVQQTNMPLAYNGDIFSKEDFERVKTEFPSVNRWMLGRGLLSNPFLPGSLKDFPLPEEPLPVVRRYVDDLYFAYRKHFNDSLRAINVMKELWSYLSLSFDHPGKVFGKIKKTKSFDAYDEAVNFVFDNFRWEGKK